MRSVEIATTARRRVSIKQCIMRIVLSFSFDAACQELQLVDGWISQSSPAIITPASLDGTMARLPR